MARYQYADGSFYRSYSIGTFISDFSLFGAYTAISTSSATALPAGTFSTTFPAIVMCFAVLPLIFVFIATFPISTCIWRSGTNVRLP